MTTLLGKLFGTFLGVEFKEDTLVISYLRNNMSGISLLSSSAFPLKNDDSTFAEIREYISQRGATPDKVFVSVPDRWAITKFTEIPSVKGKGREALSNLMRFEIERHIPFNIEEVSVDFLVLDEKGAMYSVVFVAVYKGKMDYIKDYLEKLSLRPDAVVPSSFAVLNTIELSGVSAGGLQEMIGIVRKSKVIGKKGETNICLYFDKLHASLSVIKDGLCNHQRFFSFQTMQTFSIEISEYLAELQSRLSIDRFNTLILAGDLSSAADISNDLKEKLGVNVISLDKVSDFSRKTDKAEINMLASSVGACFAGLGVATYTVNLLPHKMEYETRKLFPLSTRIFLVLILVLVTGIFTTEAVKKKRYLTKIEMELKNNAPMIATVEKLSSDTNELKNQIDLLRKLKSNETTLEILAELAGLLPKDAWITNLEYKTFDIKDKKKGIGDLILSGYASSASTLIPILEDSPYFEKVTFAGPVKKTGDKEQFRLSAEVVISAKKDKEVEAEDSVQKDELKAEGEGQGDELSVEGEGKKSEAKAKAGGRKNEKRIKTRKDIKK
ncbi:MAG: pilus assembly protein PilM [Nitrospirae bacterium]|nr:pilus assembly protein PilM [Nitrospirota bacterium]